ncbi:MAG TPA: M13-type metalloendopeptidase [Kofleriaceae bacterium]|nr:M13-type metalloendopeptidase [Kofleriaceae bacterium]
MKKNLLAAILLSAACGSNPPATKTTTTTTTSTETSSTTPEQATGAQPAVAMTTSKGKPEYGTFGFDTNGMDKSVKPGQSFYNFANGAWAKATPIPADKSNYGMFTVLSDKSDERTKEIILNAKSASGAEAQKIADFYGSFMDEAAIEKAGMDPVKPELAKIAAIKDKNALVLAFAESSHHGGETPFETGVAQDDKDPEHYIAVIGQGGLGLPDRDMYDAKNKQFEAVRQGYQKYIAAMLTLAGDKDAAKKAKAIYALEEKLAKTHWTRIQNRDPQKTYNKMTVAELQKTAPGIDWKPWLKAVGYEKETAFNVNQPTAITGLAKLVKSESLATWKDYLAFHALSEAAPYLSKNFVDTRFEFYGKTLSGTPQIKDRWKRGVDMVTGAMGEAVGKLYVDKYFTPATKAAADRLVKNLLVAMGQRLDNLAWMSDETKAKAKAKLATYNPKIGYPKKWRDYSALEIKAGDPLGNAVRADEFEYNRGLAKLGQPIDRDEWGMTPMTVNAYYNPGLNEIVFPAAILQPPFFDPNADDAVNYGGIGAVIGHEISHGFDDQGSQYDEKGALKNWWTKEDADKFKTATNMLVAQYNAYCPFPAEGGKAAQCVKGELTLGENIADLAGITVAYQAYKLSLGGKPAPVIEGFTAEQRFFLGFAQVWRRSYRDQELSNRLVTDPHSPSEFRASVPRNLDIWYDAFGAKQGEALFLPNDKRVKIW